MDSKTESSKAFSPTEYGLEDWKRILRRTGEQFRDDKVTFTAAGVAFYTLLALIPLLSTIVGMFGFFASTEQAMSIADNLKGIVPPEALVLIRRQLEELTTQNTATGFGALFSMTLTLWSGSKAMDSFIVAMNVAYSEGNDSRNFFARKGVGLTLTLGTVILIFLSASLLVWADNLEGVAGTTFKILKWPLIAAGIATWLNFLYRYAPARREAKWRWISCGAVVATLLWLLISWLFSLYVSNFGNYNKTYGSLGAVVVLILWIYLSAIALITGAEINSEMEMETARDTTKGKSRPAGERGAYVADNEADKS